MANIDKIIKSKNLPKQTNVAWVDLSGEIPVEKHFINGRWVAVSGGSSGSSFRTEKVDTTQYTTLEGFLKSATGENGVIYLYPNSNLYGENTYTELLWVEGDKKFEIIDRDIPIDSNPTSASPTPVSSGGVYTALQGKADKIRVDDTMPESGMLPNVVYQLGLLKGDSLRDITFNLAVATDISIANVWMWTFSTNDTAPTILWPKEITMWTGGDAPDIEANKYYEVSVMNGVGTVISADIPQEEEPEVEP